MEQNEFGKLVRGYRGQRGLTQAELADLWGYSRSYITQIESGKRRIDRPSQIKRLAELLNIPKERLYAIGREIPDQEQFSGASVDRSVLEMLLAPGKDMVRLSWMVWLADQHPAIEDNLGRLVVNLENTLTSYRGEFVVPAQTLLAYAHQMMGKIAFDRLDYAAATGHFAEMQELGKTLNDADVQALALIHQGDLLRKRRRYELAFQCLEAAQPYADAAARGIQGLRYIILARGFYCFGNE
jgi:transcriptional regulator with XRE-family HTH domain